MFALRKRLDAVPKDGDVVRLMKELDQDLANAEGAIKALSPRLGALEAVMPDAVCHVGVIAFNAFGNIAGNQSRSLALLNRSGDGVVISVLVGRDETLFFTKEVHGFESTEELAPEERDAIERAIGSTPAR